MLPVIPICRPQLLRLNWTSWSEGNGVKSIDTSKFGPHLTQFLEDADRAAVTLDDLDNLAATEKELERGSIAWQLQGIGENLQMIGGSLAAGIPDIGASFMDVAAVVDDVVADVTTRPLAEAGIIDRDYFGDDATWLRYHAARARQAATDILIPETEGMVEQSISSGLRSVPTSLYGLLISGATGNPNAGLGFMGAVSGSQAFSEGRKQGMDVMTSLAHGSTHGMVEFATERLPVLRMFEDFGVNASLLKKLGGQMATEVPGEQIATALQDLTDWANLPQNKDKPFSAYLEERPNAALQTLISTVVATGTQTTAVHAVDRLVNGKPFDPGELKQAQRMLASQNDQERLDVLVELAQSSKTNQRAQDIYKDFLRGAGSDQVVYVPEDIAGNLIDAPAVITDQIDGTGTDVEIPMDVFMSEVAPNEQLMSVLRPHLKMGEDLMSASEIEQGGDMEVKAALERAQKQVDKNTELSQMQERFYRQLKATGRETEDQARAKSLLVTQYANAKASDKRLNLSVKEIEDRMNLTIVGPQGGIVTEDMDFQKPPITEQDLQRDHIPDATKKVDQNKERRKDDVRRQKIDEMTPEERVRVIYKNELTGLNNRRAFDEDVADKEVVVSIDVDNLKAVNDNLGQSAGDNMLKAVADVMDQVAGGNAYHISDDEFYLLGDSRAEVDEALRAIESALADSSIQSEKGVLSGLGISYGIAGSKDAADTAMKKSKGEREDAGQRVARGEKPTGMNLVDDGQVLEQERYDGPKTALTRDDVAPFAKDIASRLEDLGFTVDDINHSNTRVGASSYIPVSLPIVEYQDGKRRFFNVNIRVSDHSVGTRRFFEHRHVTNKEDVDPLVAYLTRRKSEHEQGVPETKTLNQPTISSTQDFGDLTLSEQVRVAGTGQTVTISQSAQRVFDQTVKRRDVVRKLKDCVNA